MTNKKLITEKVTTHFLYTRAYMGHTVIGPNGKKIKWQKLREMPDITNLVTIEIDQSDPINKIFRIQPKQYLKKVIKTATKTNYGIKRVGIDDKFEWMSKELFLISEKIFKKQGYKLITK